MDTTITQFPIIGTWETVPLHVDPIHWITVHPQSHTVNYFTDSSSSDMEEKRSWSDSEPDEDLSIYGDLPQMVILNHEDSDDEHTDVAQLLQEPCTLDHVIYCLQEEFHLLRFLDNSVKRKIYLVREKLTQELLVLVVARNPTPFVAPVLPRELRIMEHIHGCEHTMQMQRYALLNDQDYAFLVPYYYHVPAYGNISNLYLLQIYMNHLLTALMCLHERSIMHRDIRSSNFLWDPIKEQGVLIDFSVSDFDAPCHTYVGHREYHSPETKAAIEAAERRQLYDIHIEQPTYDHRADIYTAGLLMLRLLTHEDLVANTTSFFRFIDKINRTGIMDQRIEWDLVMKLLTYEPEKRPSAHEALTHSFFRAPFLQDEESYRRYKCYREEVDKVWGTLDKKSCTEEESKVSA